MMMIMMMMMVMDGYGAADAGADGRPKRRVQCAIQPAQSQLSATNLPDERQRRRRAILRRHSQGTRRRMLR